MNVPIAGEEEAMRFCCEEPNSQTLIPERSPGSAQLSTVVEVGDDPGRTIGVTFVS